MSRLTLFAADIGATNSRFALFSAGLDDGSPLLTLECEQWLPGKDHASFADALRALLAPGGAFHVLAAPGTEAGGFQVPALPRPALAVIAPAGPILGPEGAQSCRVSNLPWLIDSQEAAALLGIERVLLINDFAAQAHACLVPEDVDASLLLPGAAAPGAPRAVVGAGTGFGKALLLPEEAGPKESRAGLLRRLARARVLSSEGGHCEFPFAGQRELEFAAFAAQREGREKLIFDDIVSGKGLAHIYAWLTGRDRHQHEAAAEALEEPEVMACFARFYGRACRLYVLETLALGGLFVTGGMALRLPVLEHPLFAREFYAVTGMEDLLRNTPVWHVRKAQAGLFGAALYGLLRLWREQDRG